MGGGWMASNMVMNRSWRREFAGRCRVKLRAEWETRAGMLISFVRMVPVRALRSFPPARTPAARARLWAITAHANQAPLALNDPDGKCFRAELFRSAMTCSTMAWSRWWASAMSIGSVLSVKTA